jgi:oxygen-independent coproporphyrinogen-3 oxidase
LAGIYIHIPFCRQKCHYCNFFSLASVKNKDLFLTSLLTEIRLQKDYLEGEEIETIYFGGGTPSLLSEIEISQVFNEIQKFHRLNSKPEITLEANPDDLNKDKIKALKKTPVNRFSIGVQSFFDTDLKYLNRIHSGKEALDAVRSIQEGGFRNISIDLIYGMPTLTNNKWIQNLESFFTLNISHLSAYALTVEPKTALHVLISKKKQKPVSEERIVEQFQILMSKMAEAGYVQYEISNFCKESNFSRHNRSYWEGKKYLGLGPSAHSFNGNSRQWNIPNLSQYIIDMESLNPQSQIELLSPELKYNEYILTSLRTMWGTENDYIGQKFGSEFERHFQNRVVKHIQNGDVYKKQKNYLLSDKGKLFADGIASDLFF